MLLVLHLVKTEHTSQNGSKALAGVAQWIEPWPVNQKVAGLIPRQGTCLGCRPGPQQGAQDWQPHTDVSLPLLLPLFPSKNKFFKKNETS